MFFNQRKLSLLCSILILILVSGMSSAPPDMSSSDVAPHIRISTPSYPIGLNGRDSQRVPYTFRAAGDFSGVITSRVLQFYTQYDDPLSDSLGPFATDIRVDSLQTREWNELVSLPASVVNKARAMEEYAIVLKTTFTGESATGEDFSAEASLLLLLPPAPFSKTAPANQATNQPISLSLQWNSTVGAIDYEYCFDTINNNSCDTGWIGSYGVQARLRDLPPSATFYWQVRANNTSGVTYANDGSWWSFTTCSQGLILVTNTNDSGPGSLRQAIADLCSGGTIKFASALSGRTIRPTSPLVIYKDMTIDGSSLSQNIKLDGANNIDIVLGTNQATDSTVLITDLDFLNARGHGIHQSGGKLEVRNSYFSGNDTGIFGGPQLTVTNSSFVANHTGIVNFDVLQVNGSTFTQNSRGIYNEKVYSFPGPGEATIIASVFTQNDQGGIDNRNGILVVRDSSFIENQAEYGGGIHSSGRAAIYNSQFTSNRATQNGGGLANGGTLLVKYSTFSDNTAGNHGGGVFDAGGFQLFASTFAGNRAGNFGGAIYEGGSLQMTNSTFDMNSAAQGGGIYLDPFSDLVVSTFTNNTISNSTGNGLYVNHGTLRLFNNILANSLTGYDCFTSGAAILTGSHNLVETSASSPNHCSGLGLSADPMLGPLQDNGGSTLTLALNAGSLAIDAGDDASCPSTDQRRAQRPQGSHCDIGAYEVNGSITTIRIGEAIRSSYNIVPGQSKRVSYTGVNQGPVQIANTNDTPIIAAERVIYKVKGVNTSFSEMMALPNHQLDTTYWLPWYNNVDLDTQLRFANVSGSPATVTITIGGQAMGNPIQLAAGASTRVSFAGVNNGPVKIQSNVNIVAAERLIYKANGVNTSFSEMMALPDKALDTTYWLPWYNNVDLDTQLRFANVHDTQTAQVHLFIGGVEMPNSPFTLLPGQSTRKSFPGINNGPVKIVSNVPIVAAERLIYKVGGVATSFSEMMGLPNGQLDDTYWLPWYNNVDLDTQLRFANVHASQTAQVHVFIGGVEMAGSPFTLLPGASTRQSFAGINNGPVQIVSNVPIVAAERLIYKVNNVPTSFSEMMALPDSLLDTTYWFPWYNNNDLDTQLRFGVP